MQRVARLLGLGLAVSILFNGSAVNAQDRMQIASAQPSVLQTGISQGRLAPLSERRQYVIDEKVRHLGGGLGDYRKGSAPSRKFPFVMPDNAAGENPTLVLGYVRGINTPEAHMAGQADKDHISSPTVIKVNGVKVGYLYYNDELIQVKIPREVLRKNGFNTLQIDAGFYFENGNQLSYDQIELQHLALTYD